MKNVLHILQLRRKLISISVVTERSFSCVAAGNNFDIKDNQGSVMVRTVRRGQTREWLNSHDKCI